MTNPTWFTKADYLKSKLDQLIASGDNRFSDIVALDVAIEKAGFTAYSHFESFSLVERTAPNSYFNAAEYLEAKAKQANAEKVGGKADWNPNTIALAIKDAGFATLWDHFAQFGWKEGVNPSNAFDISAYFDAKLAQLKAAEPTANWTLQTMTAAFEKAGLDPVTHALTFGVKENVAVAVVPDAEKVVPIGGVPSNQGKTFVLTAGADGGTAFTGASGNDTFNANEVGAVPAASLTALDNIDGGAGTDTLNVTATAAFLDTTNLGLTVKNIEVANFQGTKALTVDSSAWTGLTNLNVTKSVDAVTLTAANTTDVNVAAADAALTITGGKSVTIAKSMDKAADAITVTKAGAVTITATDSAAGAVMKIGMGPASNAVTGAVAITSIGGKIASGAAPAPTLGAIEVQGGTTVSVTQAATADMGDTATAGNGGNVAQGAVTVIGGAATTAVSVIQGDQVTAAAVGPATAGVNQTQVVTFKALVAKNSVTVNGLTFTAAVNMTAEQVAQAFANLTSGDFQGNSGPTASGTYTGMNTVGYTTGTAAGATVTYTEVAAGTNAPFAAAPKAAQNGGTTAPTDPTLAPGVAGVKAVPAISGVLGVTNGTVTIDDSATAKTITTVTVDGYDKGADLGVTNSLDKITTLTLKNSGAGGLAKLDTTSTGALTLNLNDVDAAVDLDASGAATLTALTINTEGVASTGAITAAAAKTVTINAAAALSGAHTFTAATLIDVNGAATVDLTGAVTNAATLLTIDASGNTGGVKAVLRNLNSVVFTGGTGKDTLTLGTSAIADTKNIDMGSGDDTLTIATGTTATTIVGTVKGGDGTDTLAMGFADAVDVSANTNFHAEVQGFERLTINNTVGVDNAAVTYTVNLANLAYNYVTVNGTNSTGAVDTLALTGMAANGTVAFGGDSAAASLYTVALADATGTADALNFVLASTDVTSSVIDTKLGTPNNAGTITANAVETFNVTSSAVDLDGATNVITANGNAVATINVSGNAGVTLKSAATTLKTVDASGLTGAGATGGLTFTANNAGMTVTGGAGNDTVTISNAAGGGKFNGGAGKDTFRIDAGADLITLDGGAGADKFVFNGVSSNKSNYAVIKAVDSGDTIDLVALGIAGFNATKLTLALGATESTQAYLDQAMTTLKLGQAGWFEFGGNTFIAADAGGAESVSSFVDSGDFVLMIVGSVNLSTASFNGTFSTLEIV